MLSRTLPLFNGSAKPVANSLAPGQKKPLTPCQLEIVRLIVDAKTNVEIATILQRSPHTVKKHVENLLDSLGVPNRAGGTPPPAGAPVVAPSFPPVVAAVAPGIEPRFRALVKQIKASANYNSTIGDALGIEGADQVGPDLTTVKPDISAVISGTHVHIPWNWGGFSADLDMCEFEVDRGQGFVLLAYDTTPGYTDTAPFPVTPTKWTYRAIYRVGDSRVGQWSNPVSVTVGG